MQIKFNVGLLIATVTVLGVFTYKTLYNPEQQALVDQYLADNKCSVAIDYMFERSYQCNYWVYKESDIRKIVAIKNAIKEK